MSDAQAVLSFSIQAHESATRVLSTVDAGFAGMAEKVKGHLKGIGVEQDKISAKKPIALVTAEQEAAVARYQGRLAALNKEIAAGGVATREQVAQQKLLNEQIVAGEAAQAKLAGSHEVTRSKADLASKAVLGVGLAVLGESAKAAIGFDTLQRSVGASTGLSGRALDTFMGRVREVSVGSTFSLGEVVPVAVALRKTFGDLGASAGKDAENVLIFAKATGQDATTAVATLDKTMKNWKIPADQMTGVMDQLLTLSQHIPGGIDQITGSISNMGPQLQAMGFGFQQSLDLMGAFAQAGISTDTVTRGLSRGLQAAAKDVGVTSGQVGGAIPVIDKYRQAYDNAQATLATTTATIRAHGYETQANRDQIVKEQEAVDKAKAAYDALNGVLAKAGGAHASISSIVQAEYQNILNAKNGTDRLNAAVALFGGRTGPAFAAALDRGKTSLAGVHALTTSATGAIEKSGKAIEQGPTAAWEKFKNQAADTAITIGKDLTPAITGVLGVVTSLGGALDGLAKNHGTLMEILGLGAIGAAGTTLLARHSPLGNVLGTRAQAAGHSGVASILTGSGGAGGGVWGVLGPAKPGSLTNPLMVRVEGHAGVAIPGGSGGAAAAEDGAAGGALSSIASKAMLGAAIFAAINAATPGNATAIGLPTSHGGAGVVGATINTMGAEGKGALNDLLSGNLGGALKNVANFAGFGTNAIDSVRKFGDQVYALEGRLGSLSPDQLANVRGEADKLAADPALAQWKTQLEAVAQTFTPLGAAMHATAGGLTADYASIAAQGGKSLGDIRAAVGLTTDYIKQTLPVGSQQANAATAAAFQAGAQAIQASVSAGVMSVAQGTKAIHDLYASALAVYGVKLPGNTTGAQAAEALKVASAGDTSLGFDPKTGNAVDVARHARGGWVGSPGEKGGDNIPIVVGRGEAVLNHQQQHVVNAGLARAGMGDLNHVFARTAGTMHYMAAGGFAGGGRVVTASDFGGHNDPSAFNRPTASGRIANDSLWGFAELSNPPGSLNFSALGHLPMGSMLDIAYGGHVARRVPKVDVGAGGPGLDGHVRAVDLGMAVANYLGFPGLGNVSIFGAGQGSGAAGGAGPAAQIAAVKAKGVSGLLGVLAQSAINRVRAAANARFASLAPAGSGAAGLGLSATGTIGAAGGPSGLGSFDGLSVADWIIPELQYAQAHGWRGRITSGYRSGFDPHAPGGSEHALTRYPGGAVDFGGMVDSAGLANKDAFIQATADYHGRRLQTAQGFRDDGHMSGTGHARGGRVYAGAFAGGGSVTASRPTMALFGDNGTETAHFVPHAATGGVISGVQQVTVAPKATPGSHATPRYLHNVLIGSYTTAEWHAYLLAHPAATHPAHDVGITLPGFGSVGSETVTTGSAVSLGSDVQKMTSAAWAKVVAAITKALKAESPAVQIREADALSSESVKQKASARLKALVAQVDAAAVAVFDKTFQAAQTALGAATTSIAQHQTLTGAKWALSHPLGAVAPTSVTFSGYKTQLAAYAGAEKTDTAEESQIRSAIANAKKHHNSALVKSLTTELDTIDQALVQTKIDTATLQENYRQALYDAFTTGIANMAGALDAAATGQDTQMQIVSALQHVQGTDNATLAIAKGKQNGSLTAAQIAQANANLASFTSGTRSEESSYQGEIGVEQAALNSGQLNATDAQAARNQVQQLTLKIAQLEAAITDQTSATTDLISATAANTTATSQMTGAVSYSFRGQNYISGGSQTSNDAAAIGLGI